MKVPFKYLESTLINFIESKLDISHVNLDDDEHIKSYLEILLEKSEMIDKLKISNAENEFTGSISFWLEPKNENKTDEFLKNIKRFQKFMEE